MLTTVETNRLKTPENNLALVGNHNYGSLNSKLSNESPSL